MEPANQRIRIFFIGLGVMCGSPGVGSADPLADLSVDSKSSTAFITGSTQRVAIVRHAKVDLLHVVQTAKAFNWTIKYVGKGDERMLVVCRETICLPIVLKDTPYRESVDGMFVAADVLARVMGFKITRAGNRLLLSANESQAKPLARKIPAYHDDWGPGRGFRKGQTLPDIPLVDMKGNEVRLGKFLGKQYILYGWASW